MRGGKLRNRVEIQAVTETVDSYGQPVKTWATVDKRWAAIEDSTGREFERAKQFAADMTHLVRMRFYDGLTQQHRIKFGSRIFGIESVNDMDQRNREHVLSCKEIV